VDQGGRGSIPACSPATRWEAAFTSSRTRLTSRTTGGATDTQIVCYSRTSRFKDAYLLFPDFGQPDEDIAPGVFSGDGHCSFSPDGRWMLTDGYPDKDGYQGLILFDGKKRIDVFVSIVPSPPPSTPVSTCTRA
jgi:hypothetical protein